MSQIPGFPEFADTGSSNQLLLMGRLQGNQTDQTVLKDGGGGEFFCTHPINPTPV